MSLIRSSIGVVLSVVAITITLLAPESQAQGTCAIFKTYITGDSFGASDANSIQTTIGQSNAIVSCIDDDSVDAATMQSTTDPYPADTISLSTTLQGELRRLRYVIKKLTGWTQWYAHSEAFVFPNAARFSSAGPHGIAGATSATASLNIGATQFTASGTLGATVRIVQATTGGTGNAALWVVAGNTYLGGTAANANMTVGLTLNQGAADNEILALKSSDVAHGMTDLTETDTVSHFTKTAVVNGGIDMVGYSAATSAIRFVGRGTTDNTGKTTGGIGYIDLIAQKRSLTTVGAPGVDANLVTIGSSTTTRFIFDAEGSAHADVEWVAFQDHDDVTLLRNVERELRRGARIPGAPPSADRRELTALGLVGADGPNGERGLMNMTRLQMLQAGAVRQAHDVIDLLLDDLMSRRPLTPQEKARIPAGIRARKGIAP